MIHHDISLIKSIFACTNYPLGHLVPFDLMLFLLYFCLASANAKLLVPGRG